jgi:hypothetical protein
MGTYKLVLTKYMPECSCSTAHSCPQSHYHTQTRSTESQFSINWTHPGQTCLTNHSIFSHHALS